MTTSPAIGPMAAAGGIGAIEPDDLAGVSPVTNGAGNSRQSALVGASFGPRGAPSFTRQSRA